MADSREINLMFHGMQGSLFDPHISVRLRVTQHFEHNVQLSRLCPSLFDLPPGVSGVARFCREWQLIPRLIFLDYDQKIRSRVMETTIILVSCACIRTKLLL